MSSKATRFLYGMNFDSPNDLGGNRPPMIDGDWNGTGDFISGLSACKANGSRCIVKFTGSANNAIYIDSQNRSAYSEPKWKFWFDKCLSKTNAQQMGNFVQDGTLVAHYMFDDYQPGTVFQVAPTFAQIEEAGRYSKSFWSQVPTCLRGANQYNRDICLAAGASHYTYVDFGWHQWADRHGAAQPYFINGINAGRTVGLGCMGGLNLLKGGSGITAPWNQGVSPRFTMSPQEIDAVANAFSVATYLIGCIGWSARETADDTNYYELPSIQTALTRLAGLASTRLAGPINWRTTSGSIDSNATSASTVTVIGAWSLVRDGQAIRNSNQASLTVPYNQEPEQGNLILLQVYSRDSNMRSPVCPSDFSEAHRVSGNSAQGGVMALFYKVAGSNEGVSKIVTFAGTGGTGCAQIGASYEAAGNYPLQTGVLSAVGSAKSWTAVSTNMGPVPGLVSANSDALVVVCAARANDFLGLNLPPTDTISATTGEAWVRALLAGTASGDDAGIMMDVVSTSGIASIGSKSWSQTTQASSSNFEGPGCGFMVAFRPASVVAGQPPAIEGLDEDVFMSLGSTLSFVVQSTGSTPITWSRVSGPSNATFDSSTGVFSWTPSATGTFVITLRATNVIDFDEETFSVIVQSGSNLPPVITDPGDQVVRAQEQLSFKIVSSDPNGDTVAYGFQDSPAGALIVSDTGQFIWRPTGAQGPGTYPVVVLVTDGQNTSRSTFTISVGDTLWTNQVITAPNSFRRL